REDIGDRRPGRRPRSRPPRRYGRRGHRACRCLSLRTSGSWLVSPATAITSSAACIAAARVGVGVAAIVGLGIAGKAGNEGISGCGGWFADLDLLDKAQGHDRFSFLVAHIEIEADETDFWLRRRAVQARDGCGARKRVAG